MFLCLFPTYWLCPSLRLVSASDPGARTPGPRPRSPLVLASLQQQPALSGSSTPGARIPRCVPSGSFRPFQRPSPLPAPAPPSAAQFGPGSPGLMHMRTSRHEKASASTNSFVHFNQAASEGRFPSVFKYTFREILSQQLICLSVVSSQLETLA